MAKKSLPTIALARTEPKHGSRAWVREILREHGNTKPLKLEHRRQRLSSFSVVVDDAVNKVQLAKKVFSASSKKMISAKEAERKALRTELPEDRHGMFDAETEVILSEINAAVSGQELQYEITIATLVAQLANIEGHCLAVDCNSIRIDGKVKGKQKWGIARYSGTSYLQDIGGELIALSAMIYELFKVSVDAETLARFEKEMESKGPDTELDEEEALTEETKEEPKKEEEEE